MFLTNYLKFCQAAVDSVVKTGDRFLFITGAGLYSNHVNLELNRTHCWIWHYRKQHNIRRVLQSKTLTLPTLVFAKHKPNLHTTTAQVDFCFVSTKVDEREREREAEGERESEERESAQLWLGLSKRDAAPLKIRNGPITPRLISQSEADV